MKRIPLYFDSELIGSNKPRFLVCVQYGRIKDSFWMHKRGDMKRLEALLKNPKFTWIGFNSENFDRPLIAAAMQGADEMWLKRAAQIIIDERMNSWKTYKHFNIDFLEYDHIDLFETAPGVQVSLKRYMGRMAYPTMIDMPFEHDHDLKPSELPIVEMYCFNDIGGTKALHEQLKDQIALRIQLGDQHDIDLRSKSDAQCAEAIIKKAMGITKVDKSVPKYVNYSAPSFIKTNSKPVLELINKLESQEFEINTGNGSPMMPEWMKEEFHLGHGRYQVGLGGLHSAHDVNFHAVANENLLISDFDVASYYPTLIIKAGLVPRFGGNRGQRFLDEYVNIYERRLEAKRAGNKVEANTLKILLNGTFGKLGSIYSAFYSPDLLLAVTITGQLNLLCLIDELEKIKNVCVYSANTDGITVGYPPEAKDKVLKVFEKNAKRTGFEYEETPYTSISMKDVNNYIAITTSGKVKAKGLYGKGCVSSPAAPQGKNPTCDVCAMMATDFLLTGEHPESSIKRYKDIRDYVAVREVKGGGVQHTHTVEIDDWILVIDNGNASNVWQSPRTDKREKRKSKPAPYLLGTGGKPFGRVARWYMTTETLPPITYVESGNMVPKTEGAKLCMELPSKLPADLNKQWYVDEAYSILSDLGVTL